MTIHQAFSQLIERWDSLPSEFRTRNRMWKSRYLNHSGKQTKEVGESKMRELLIESGYEEYWFPPD